MGGLSDWEARIWLASVVEPGDIRIGRALNDYLPSEIISKPQLHSAGLRDFLSDRKLSDVVTTSKAVDADFLTPTHPQWPSGLDLLGELAPLGIWKRGKAPQPALTVSVVGARSCSAYGESVALNIAAELNQLGLGVVSGGAFGIDAAAHRGAVLAEGKTVAVLAGGVDVPYPRANSNLFDRILETGWLVSESPPGQIPLKHRFLIRNRLIAAWSLGTVVVEARIRSGAIATASHANNLGLEVMAIPGPVTAAASTGCHQLIRDGATLVTNASEIIHQLQPHKSLAK